MGPRHRGRELAFQVLFQIDLTGDKVNMVMERFEGLKVAQPEAAAFARRLAQGAFAALPEIDGILAGTVENWKPSRLLSVDRAVLRLGAHELAHEPDVPLEVVLDECIELARLYGSDESPAFVNGVLDRLAAKLRPGEKRAKLPDGDA